MIPPTLAASQHERARGPRPLPLFLDLVRRQCAGDPQRIKAALAGVAAYQDAPRQSRPDPMPAIAEIRGAALRDYGGDGPPLVVVPSLINPPHILDLDPETSLLRWLAGEGSRVFLVDWGRAAGRADLDIRGHVREILAALLSQAGAHPALLGYCLGGTMATMVAIQTPVRTLSTIAAPLHFEGYEPSRAAIERLWAAAAPTAEALGLLPMEILQSGFWGLDPARTVQKFIDFAAADPASAESRRFVALEDWANDGDPLPFPAARELFGWMTDPPPVRGEPVEALHFVSTSDRIVPLASTPRTGTRVDLSSGHVGMIVGSHARETLWQPLADWLRSR